MKMQISILAFGRTYSVVSLCGDPKVLSYNTTWGFSINKLKGNVCILKALEFPTDLRCFVSFF